MYCFLFPFTLHYFSMEIQRLIKTIPLLSISYADYERILKNKTRWAVDAEVKKKRKNALYIANPVMIPD